MIATVPPASIAQTLKGVFAKSIAVVIKKSTVQTIIKIPASTTRLR